MLPPDLARERVGRGVRPEAAAGALGAPGGDDDRRRGRFQVHRVHACADADAHAGGGPREVP
eukprot:4855491-Heterocapsa_arctica.AAC.1